MYGRNIKYKKQGYTIIKTMDKKVKLRKYIVFKDGNFKKQHTHVSTFKLAKTMIDIVVNEKKPTSKNKDFIDSLIRLSTNKQYIQTLQDVLTNI
jgi:hypothetical protein